MIFEKLIIYGGLIISILGLIGFISCKKLTFSAFIFGGLIIIIIGHCMLNIKKDYISKIEGLIEYNTPAEKEQLNKFKKELEKTNLYTLSLIYRDLRYRDLKLKKGE